MFAVIKTGGKQYKVAQDDKLTVEKLDASVGDIVELTDVLMVGGDGTPEIGAPMVSGAMVAAEVLEQSRSDKIIVFKKKRRKDYRRTHGHRQDQTVLRITEILTGGKKPSKAKSTAKKADTKAAKKPAAKKETTPKTADAKKPETKAAVKDDLSLIGGVGPVLVKKLDGLGYTSLQQIADLTPEQAAEIDEKLSFKGRIEREDWIGQAKDLLAGKPPRAKTDQKAAAKKPAAKK